MKDFKDWGVKRRCFPNNNYNAIWFNLKTVRLGDGIAKELELILNAMRNVLFVMFLQVMKV